MIGKISGEIVDRDAPTVVVQTKGIGYEVEVPIGVFYTKAMQIGEQVTLYTHMAVREEVPTLYGFATKEQRTLFRMMLKIPGIGPKIGLGLLSGMDRRTLAECIRKEDVGKLVRVPGIGRKVADKLVFELKGAFGSEEDGGARAGMTPVGEACAALEALGFSNREAQRRVESAAKGEREIDTERLVKKALQSITG